MVNTNRERDSFHNGYGILARRFQTLEKCTRMTETYQLFQYRSCPFCYRVQRFLDKLELSVPLRDTLRDPQARVDLIEGGGKATVPCLRIDRQDEIIWLYESSDIIEYLGSV